MTTTTELPLNLYQANLALWQSAGKLLQDSGQQWLEQGKQGADLHALAKNAASSQAALLAGLAGAMQTWRQAVDIGAHLVPQFAPPFTNSPGDWFKPFGK